MMSDESLHFPEKGMVTNTLFSSFLNSEKRAEASLSISSLVTVNHWARDRGLKYGKSKIGNKKSQRFDLF